MTDVVTIQHCREAGYCVDGVRRHCRVLGLDFKRLVREGIPISEVQDIDDEIVRSVIAQARKEGENHGKQ